MDLQKRGPTVKIIKGEDPNGSDPHREDLDGRDHKWEDPSGTAARTSRRSTQ